MTSGTDRKDLKSTNLIPNKGTPIVGRKYKVDISKAIIVSVSLKEEGVGGVYRFEYWSEGAEADFFDRFSTWINELGRLYYVFIVCVACCGLIVLCCMGICARSYYDSKHFDKVEPHDGEMILGENKNK